ncbi:hypothetical protein BCR42DRAFT_411781 [Absidia repens]|uniref:Uncharacterized protein n=1 Tax=Absidia repens TaxID=90262 RepID=A0A1X2IM73_9FUNG|nr:hypothetical protein BCR42DRAFT_411781 [Absidia repens]
MKALPFTTIPQQIHMSKSPNHVEQLILDAIEELRPINDQLTFSDLYNHLRCHIIKSFKDNRDVQHCRSYWMKNIYSACNRVGVQIDKGPTEKETLLDILKDISTNNPTKSSSAKTLTPSDKLRIQAIYDTMDETKMWTLSTGKKVETTMRTLAMSCEYEHPCHSLILDVNDTTWDDYFTKEELMEIEAYNDLTFPPLPSELAAFLDNLSTAKNAKEARQLIFANGLDDSDVESCKWAKTAVISAAQLFDGSPIGVDFARISEGDLLVRPWNMLSSAFETSLLEACPGEVTSEASTTAMNLKRGLGGVERKDRIKCAPKVDLLYRKGNVELGCMEAGREQGILTGSSSTKELNCGWLKLPKTLKDMLYTMTVRLPALTNKLYATGFIVMGSKLMMMVVTCPCGYVAKVSRTKDIFFPTNTTMFPEAMKKILSLVWTGRMLMESTILLLSSAPSSSSSSPTLIKRQNRFAEPDSLLQPAFHPSHSSFSSSTSSASSSSSASPVKKRKSIL